MAAHPVYLYTPGGSFLQTPDGRPLLMQVSYVGTLDNGAAETAATARATAAETNQVGEYLADKYGLTWTTIT